MNNRNSENNKEIANASNDHFIKTGATLSAKLPNNCDNQKFLKKWNTLPVAHEDWTKTLKLNNINQG